MFPLGLASLPRGLCWDISLKQTCILCFHWTKKVKPSMTWIYLEMLQDKLTLAEARNGDSRYGLVPSESIISQGWREGDRAQTDTALSLQEELPSILKMEATSRPSWKFPWHFSKILTALYYTKIAAPSKTKSHLPYFLQCWNIVFPVTSFLMQLCWWGIVVTVLTSICLGVFTLRHFHCTAFFIFP